MRKGFISYSHADRAVCDALFKHLADVNRRLVRFWRDPDLKPGDQNWNKTIGWHIQRSHVALVLVSSDSMKGGGFVPDRELPLLQRRVRIHGAALIPVIVRPYDRKAAREISDMEAIPKKGQPLGRDATPGQTDDWCEAVVGEIRQFIEGLPPLDEHPSQVRNLIDSCLKEIDAIESSSLLDDVEPGIASDCQKHLSGLRAALQAPRSDLRFYINGVAAAWFLFCKGPLNQGTSSYLTEPLLQFLGQLESALIELQYDWPPDQPAMTARSRIDRENHRATLRDLDEKIDSLEEEAQFLGQPGTQQLRSMETEISAQAAVSRALLAGPKPDVGGASVVLDNAVNGASILYQELVAVSPRSPGSQRDRDNARRVETAATAASMSARRIIADGTANGPTWEKRRIEAMLSSTFHDLEEHRQVVTEIMTRHNIDPLVQEFDVAAADMDLIKASLDTVDRADALVCLIGLRYGLRPVDPVRNPDRLSLTELEFRRALERNLPIFTFVMGPEHKLTLNDFRENLEQEDAGNYFSLRSFISTIGRHRVAVEFTSLDDLKAKVTLAMLDLQRLLAKTRAASRPLHFVLKPSIEDRSSGRKLELELIDKWASGPDPMLIVQAIGGMGKSTLAWQWAKNQATVVRTDWAGRFWYSFYEHGSNLNDFCVHALSYFTQQPPSAFRGRSTTKLGSALRLEMDQRPWLLILDGLERVLVAYNRSGDREELVPQDGVDRDPSGCFRPEEDEVLAALAHAKHGKLLATSRLVPTVLRKWTSSNVRVLSLEGMRPEDAETMLRDAGVRGDALRMRKFLSEQFGGHPLSVALVAGLVNSFAEAPGDFDHWLMHPRGGAAPNLLGQDLVGRRSNILLAALDSLGNNERVLLSNLALVGGELTGEVVELLNPVRPSGPENFQSPEVWQRETDRANAWLRQALLTLEARGLVQFEKGSGHVDLHPAVRHTAIANLTPDALARIGSSISYRRA